MKCFLCILDNDNTLHSSNQQEYVHAQSRFGGENFNLLNKMIKIGMKKMYPCCFITMIPAFKSMKHQNDSLVFYKWLVNALTYYAYIHTDFRQNT